MKRQEQYDAIVVGSGITGGWAAKELTERGLNTLVLEAGRPTRFDHQAVGRAIADALSGQAPPADAADIEALLLPEVEAHYRDWEAPAPVPYVSYNSRR